MRFLDILKKQEKVTNFFGESPGWISLFKLVIFLSTATATATATATEISIYFGEIH